MKKLAIGIAVLILLAAAAATVAPFVVPTDSYKSRLIAAVKDSTGRDLKIGGSISFSLLPQITLSAQDVSLANAPGGIARDMVQLKSLVLRLKLLPLLTGTVAVDSLVLVDPTVALEIGKDGRPNWDFSRPGNEPASAQNSAPSDPTPSPEAASAAPASGDSRGGLAALARLRLGDIELQNGEVSYADQRSQKRWDVSAINMSLSMADLDSPLAARGSTVWNGEPVNLDIDIADPGALAAGTETDVALKLASKPLDLDFSGGFAGGPNMNLAGGVDLEVPSVRALAQWAGAPISMAGSGLGPFSLRGKVVAAGNIYAFTDAVIALDGIKATGAASVDTANAKPYAKGNLAVETLDLNPYLAPEGNPAPAGPADAAPPGAGSGNAAQPGWSTAPIDLSSLNLADADFDLSADAIRYRRISAGKSALAVHLKGGVLNADLSRIALYKGTGQGKVTVDGAAASPAISESFTLQNIDVGPLLRDAAGMDQLSGTGSLDMSVAGHGKSQRDIMASLSGKGSLALDKGALKGIDMLAAVKSAAATLAGGSSQTNFTTLTATYAISSGILKNNDLKMNAPGLPVTGAGTVDLPRRRVDYKLTPKIAGSLSVPVDITGPWDDLAYRPDLAGLANQGGALQNLIKNPSNLDKLKNLLGGVKP
jgi:AsmA protein